MPHLDFRRVAQGLLKSAQQTLVGALTLGQVATITPVVTLLAAATDLLAPKPAAALTIAGITFGGGVPRTPPSGANEEAFEQMPRPSSGANELKTEKGVYAFYPGFLIFWDTQNLTEDHPSTHILSIDPDGGYAFSSFVFLADSTIPVTMKVSSSSEIGGATADFHSDNNDWSPHQYTSEMQKTRERFASLVNTYGSLASKASASFPTGLYAPALIKDPATGDFVLLGGCRHENRETSVKKTREGVTVSTTFFNNGKSVIWSHLFPYSSETAASFEILAKNFTSELEAACPTASSGELKQIAKILISVAVTDAEEILWAKAPHYNLKDGYAILDEESQVAFGGALSAQDVSAAQAAIPEIVDSLANGGSSPKQPALALHFGDVVTVKTPSITLALNLKADGVTPKGARALFSGDTLLVTSEPWTDNRGVQWINVQVIDENGDSVPEQTTDSYGNPKVVPRGGSVSTNELTKESISILKRGATGQQPPTQRQQYTESYTGESYAQPLPQGGYAQQSRYEEAYYRGEVLQANRALNIYFPKKKGWGNPLNKDGSLDYEDRSKIRAGEQFVIRGSVNKPDTGRLEWYKIDAYDRKGHLRTAFIKVQDLHRSGAVTPLGAVNLGGRPYEERPYGPPTGGRGFGR